MGAVLAGRGDVEVERSRAKDDANEQGEEAEKDVLMFSLATRSPVVWDGVSLSLSAWRTVCNEEVAEVFSAFSAARASSSATDVDACLILRARFAGVGCAAAGEEASASRSAARRFRCVDGVVVDVAGVVDVVAAFFVFFVFFVGVATSVDGSSGTASSCCFSTKKRAMASNRAAEAGDAVLSVVVTAAFLPEEETTLFDTRPKLSMREAAVAEAAVAAGAPRDARVGRVMLAVYERMRDDEEGASR